MDKYYYKIILCFMLIFILLFTVKARAILPLQGKLIVIDPGHGGKDPGALYKEIYEKNINLEISKYLEK